MNITTNFARLRSAAAIAMGTPFHLPSLERLVENMRGRGPGKRAARADSRSAFPLDEKTVRYVQLRRFRAQANRAAQETDYYRQLFRTLAVDPARLNWEELSRIPLTSKSALREAAERFVRSGARPCFRTTTTGTTGSPAHVCFSEQEMRTYISLNALAQISGGRVNSEDVVQISMSTRASLGNTCFGSACARIGALVHLSGLIAPERSLALLAASHPLPGKKPKVSVLVIYPSYLGELITWGQRLGYTPADFGIERIAVGGEAVTQGLKARCRRFFGAVAFDESYAMTETWPTTGMRCEQGHLHFEIAQSLTEVLDPESGAPAQAGEAGSLVVTPFMPYRDTTLLLRYDTEDMVRPLAGPFNCSLAHLPATSDILGKRSLAVRHPNGWTFPRDITEALEEIEEIPLPARYGFWAESEGVTVEVVIPCVSTRLRNRIAEALKERRVPLHMLHLVEDRDHLQQPFPLRGGLREGEFHRPRSEEGSLCRAEACLPGGRS